MPNKEKIIRLARFGCTNRPFFRLVVTQKYRASQGPVIEQVGSFDPMPNKNNEKLVALNIDRIKMYLAYGADMSKPAAKLLGDFCFHF